MKKWPLWLKIPFYLAIIGFTLISWKYVISPIFDSESKDLGVDARLREAQTHTESAQTVMQTVIARLERLSVAVDSQYIAVKLPLVGYIENSGSYQAKVSHDSFLVKTTANQVVPDRRSFKKQFVFCLSGNVVNGQLFIVISAINDNGVKTGLPAAVAFERIQFLASDNEASNKRAEVAQTQLSQAVLHTALNPNQAAQIVNIPCNVLWTNTGITVPDSCLLTIRMSGSFLNRGYGNTVTPEGVGGCGFDTGNPRICNDSPLASFGWVGNGSPPVVTPGQSSNAFRIGLEKSLTIFRGGQLYIGCNDDGLGDNQGSWSAQIIITPLATT